MGGSGMGEKRVRKAEGQRAVPPRMEQGSGTQNCGGKRARRGLVLTPKMTPTGHHKSVESAVPRLFFYSELRVIPFVRECRVRKLGFGLISGTQICVAPARREEATLRPTMWESKAADDAPARRRRPGFARAGVRCTSCRPVASSLSNLQFLCVKLRRTTLTTMEEEFQAVVDVVSGNTGAVGSWGPALLIKTTLEVASAALAGGVTGRAGCS